MPNVNPQDAMLNSLHLLLFWKVHEKGTTVDGTCNLRAAELLF